MEYGSFNLGGKKSEYGKIDLSKLKSGIKAEDIKDEALRNAFMQLAGEDGVLNRADIDKLQNYLAGVDKNGDGTISNNEGKKALLDDHKAGKDGRSQLFKLLKTLADMTKDVLSVKTEDGAEVVSYEDGHVEKIYDDGRKEVKTKENGKTVTEFYEKTDGAEEPVLAKRETVNDNGDNKTEIIKDGKPVKTTNVTQNGNNTEVINEENESAYRTVTDKNKGSVEVYDKQNNFVSRSLNNGKVVESYENGKLVKTVNTEREGITETKYLDSETENEVTETKQIIDGHEVVDRIETKDGREVKTKYVDNKPMQQQIGQYTVKYDSEGNTIGVIVQNAESVSEICKKFNVSKEALIEANKDQIHYTGKIAWFRVGADIKIPRLVDADDKALQGRLTREQAIAEWNKAYEARMVAQAAASNSSSPEPGQSASQDAQNASLSGQAVNTQSEWNTVGNDVKTEEYNKINENAEVIAKNIKTDIEGLGTNKAITEHLAEITEDNAFAVVNKYREKSPKEGIAEAILDEVGWNMYTERLAVIEEIYNKLEEKANALGIDVSECSKEFKKAAGDYRDNTGSLTNNKSFDKIFDTLSGAIEQYYLLSNEEIEELNNTSFEQKQEDTVISLKNIVQESKDSLEKQLKYDGWAGKAVDWMSGAWGSKNRKKFVEKDLDKYEKQVNDLENCASEEEFKSKFKEIYGVEYNANLVRAYQAKSEKMVAANYAYFMEQSFNEDFKSLINNDELKVATTTYTTYVGSSYLEDRERTFSDMERKFKQYLVSLGVAEDSAAAEEKLAEDYAEAGLSKNADIDEKYGKLHKFAVKYSNLLHKNVLNTTEGKGYEAYKNEYDRLYTAAFGLSNEIADRVNKYNMSQQTGAMVLKSGAKAGVAIASCFIPGVGVAGVAAITASSSAAIDLSDRMSSEVGLQEGEVMQILKNAAIDGATVLAGGGIAKMLCNAGTFVKIGGQLAGDVATGAGAEYLQTGQISLAGVAFQCVFSAAGNLVAIKQIARSANAPVDSPTLRKATSSGEAPAGTVSVGEKKAAAIQQEVKDAVGNSAPVGNLADMHHQADGLGKGNRAVRREVQGELDKAAASRSAVERAEYNTRKLQDLKNEVEAMFEKNTVANESQIRKLREYISQVNDEKELSELAARIEQKYKNRGMNVDTEKDLLQTIEKKTAHLRNSNEWNAMSAAEQRDKIHSRLVEQKGLNELELDNLNRYIESVTDPEELTAIARLIRNNKKIGSGHRTNLNNGIEARRQALDGGQGVHADKVEEPKVHEGASGGDVPNKPDAPTPAPAADPGSVIVNPSTLQEYYTAPSAEPVKIKQKQRFLGFTREEIVVEVRTVDDVYGYLNSYRKLGYIERDALAKLFETNPKRFNRIANSGLFELIEKDYLDRNVLKNIFKGVNENVFFSNRFLAEVSLAKSQLDQGLTPSFVKTIPNNAPADYISNNIRIGDVYQKDGALFVRSGDDCFTQINMTKEAFDKMFPPGKLSAFSQGGIGDCWLVSAIDNLLDYPEGRAKIFSLFEQVDDDIYVKLPEAEEAVKFSNGEVLDADGRQIKGAKGVQMIEQAYMYHALKTNRINLLPEELAKLTSVPEQMKVLHSGNDFEAWNVIVGKSAIMWKKSYNNVDVARDIILNNANGTDFMLGISFKKGTPIPGQSENLIDDLHYLYAKHSYALKSYDPKTGMCYLTNPWNASTLIEIPMEDMLKHFNNLKILQIKQYMIKPEDLI